MKLDKWLPEKYQKEFNIETENRYHHHVNFNKFKNNILIKKKDLKLENKINNYGMELKIKTDEST